MEHHLIYVSKANHLMSEAELLDILEVSRKWNSDHHITGMLLYIEGLFANPNTRQIKSDLSGRFMQVLEGSKEEVDRVFAMIQIDPRHHNLTVLQQNSERERHFQNWKMGFKSLSLNDYQNTPGFFDLNPSFLNSSQLRSSGIPLQFLKSFYQRGSQETTIFCS